MQMVKFPARAAAARLLMKHLTKSDAADPGGGGRTHDTMAVINSAPAASSQLRGARRAPPQTRDPYLQYSHAAPVQTGHDQPSVCTSGAPWKNKRHLGKRMKRDVLVEAGGQEPGTGEVMLSWVVQR